MACYEPLGAIQLGIENGKKKIKIYGKYDKDFPVLEEHMNLKLKCSRCIGCRLSYSADWATRCVNEASMTKHSFFITLTYDEDNVSKSEKWYADENGEVIYANTLVPRDFTLFFKRLRKYYKDNYDLDGIKYFACGEYGSKTLRPHYHFLGFGFPIPDLIKKGINFSKEELFTSEIISKLWGKGFCLIGDVSYESAGYVARYIMKKNISPSVRAMYEKKGIVPEFTRMSMRGGGIGKSYFLKNWKSISSRDYLLVNTSSGVKEVNCPRYYDKLLERLDPSRLFRNKTKRANVMNLRDYSFKFDHPNLDIHIKLRNELNARTRKSDLLYKHRKGV